MIFIWGVKGIFLEALGDFNGENSGENSGEIMKTPILFDMILDLSKDFGW